MLRKLRRFLALSGPRKRAFLNAWLFVILVRAGLSYLSFPTLLRWVGFLSRSRTHRRARTPDPDEFAWAVDTASRYAPNPTCLTRALALNALLARRGLPTQIKIGVAKDPHAGIKSHAWVEHEGRVILGGLQDLGDFSTMVSIERAAQLLGRGLPL